MIKDYSDIDNFLNEFWNFRNHIISVKGFFRAYSNPIRFLKLYKAVKNFKIKRTTDSLQDVYNIGNQVYKVPDSIKSLVDFYKNEIPNDNIPQNILIAKYLTNEYKKCYFEVIYELQKLYIPDKDPIFNLKNISLISTLLTSLLLKNNPKILKDLGINIETIIQSDLYYPIIIFIIYIGILVLMIFISNYQIKRKIEFKINCLKSCVLINKGD